MKRSNIYRSRAKVYVNLRSTFSTFFWGGGGGRGALNKVLYGLFYIPFLIEKVRIPLSYTFHRKRYPFHIPTERLLLNFHLRNPLKYGDESAVRCVCSRYTESPF